MFLAAMLISFPLGDRVTGTFDLSSITLPTAYALHGRTFVFEFEVCGEPGWILGDDRTHIWAVRPSDHPAFERSVYVPAEWNVRAEVQMRVEVRVDRVLRRWMANRIHYGM